MSQSNYVDLPNSYYQCSPWLDCASCEGFSTSGNAVFTS